MALRAEALALVLPPHAVVTDRTAAWLHGVSILPRAAPGADLPDLQCFGAPGNRMRRGRVRSGERQLLARDVVVVDQIRVTSPLRTACDLGRLLFRFDALAALDGFARAGVSAAAVRRETLRFKGMRGVVMLRALTELMDPAAESPGESALRLHWVEAGLPAPVLQHRVPTGRGSALRLDLADPEVKYAAEYDGEQFHGPDREAHDAALGPGCASRGGPCPCSGELTCTAGRELPTGWWPTTAWRRRAPRPQTPRRERFTGCPQDVGNCRVSVRGGGGGRGRSRG